MVLDFAENSLSSQLEKQQDILIQDYSPKGKEDGENRGFGKVVSINDQMQFYEHEGLLKNGKPRLECARFYFLALRDLDFKGLRDYYETWRSLTEFLVLHRHESGIEKKKTIAVKCSKRGNDVYWRRVEQRLRVIKDVEDVEFFNKKTRELTQSRAVFVTLTYDTKLSSVQDAWIQEGISWNRWISNLRDKFGEISYIRCFESFVNGYPHIHALLVFKDHEFNVFRQYSKAEKKLVFRIQEKAIFESSWDSNVDVRACASLRSASLYITKYLTKGFYESSDEALDKSLRGLTLSMNWIFHKKSFAVSKDLLDLILSLRNSKPKPAQFDLFGEKHPSIWQFIGIKTIHELKSEYPDLNFDRSWKVELPYCAWDPLN
jgi:hypothetical protein